MSAEQRVFVAPYVNLRSEFMSEEKQRVRVQPRINSVATHLARLNHRAGGKLFNNAAVLHSSRQPAVLMAAGLKDALSEKKLNIQTVTNEAGYELGNNPRMVKAPRDWLLRAARESLGNDWNGSPLVAFVPSGFVDYLNGEYNALAPTHDAGPEPLIELTDEFEAAWQVHPQQAEFAQRHLETQRIDQLAGFGSL